MYSQFKISYCCFYLQLILLTGTTLQHSKNFVLINKGSKNYFFFVFSHLTSSAFHSEGVNSYYSLSTSISRYKIYSFQIPGLNKFQPKEVPDALWLF